MEAIDGQRKAPLWRQGQAWAPVCLHTASPSHTLVGDSELSANSGDRETGAAKCPLLGEMAEKDG